jgi:hypothetical protein
MARKAELTASTNLEIGDTGDGVVGTMSIGFKASVDWTGKSVTLKARKKGSGGDFKNVAYRRRDTDAVVAGGTAITSDLDVEINAAGLEVRVDFTYGGTGNLAVTWEPLQG